MGKGYFIAATGTDIGKTLVTAALGWQLCKAHKPVQLIKPIMSGFNAENLAKSDSGQLLQAMGQEPSIEAIKTISPWRFEAPVSPHLAGQVSVEGLLQFCQTQMANHPLTLIEGAGGVMTPLTQGYTQLDLMKDLRLPVVLVTGSYVGALSHSLTAMEAMKAAGVELQAIVVSESEASATSLEQTAQSIEEYGAASCRVFTLPRISFKTEPWKHAPSLLELLDD